VPEAPLITLEKAAFGYAGQTVLDNVTLHVQPRDFIGLIGPNGAGKTTLFRGLLGLLAPMRGQVARPTLMSRHIGYVPQRDTLDSLYPVTAREVVRMGLVGQLPWYRFVGASFDSTIDAALAQVGMQGEAQDSFFELSGGQRQRVLIARALVSAPRLLVLDEPTAGVDPEAEKKILDLLASLHQHQGLTILMVTHHVQVIRSHANRILTVKEGTVFEGAMEL